MSDDSHETDAIEPLRALRPDRLLPDDPPNPELLSGARAQLMASIGAPAEPHRATPALYPRLAYRDEMAALDFLVRAFGFRERREARLEHEDGTLAWLEVGDGVVMIGRAGTERHDLHSPAEVGATTAMINVYVTDIDEHFERAKVEGARIASEPQDMFWGERRYEALDPEGHRWHFSERLES